MHKVLVTGDKSFTASHLLPLLKDHNYFTHGLSEKVGDSFRDVDITDYDRVEAAIADLQPESIIHLAGISFAAHPNPLELYKVNLLGTENILRAVYKVTPNIKKIILASSANIYGSYNSTHIDESVCPSPVNHYAASKLAMENMAKTWMSKLPITIVRPFNYTGIGQDNKFLIPKIVSHFSKKLPEIELGNINIARDFTDVRTICHYYLQLLETNAGNGEVLNFCSGRIISLEKVLEDMNNISGHNLKVKINPAFIRETDIIELSGNPHKLYSLIGSIDHRPFRETLSWMFHSSVISEGL